MRRAASDVLEVVKPVVDGLGYIFVGAEFGMAENGQTLRVFIDGQTGVDIDDCAAVSRQLDGVLDVADVIDGAYQLEVSSPGLDRPLFTEEQFAAQIGETVRVRMETPLEGRRNFKGQLVAIAGGIAVVMVDGERYELPLEEVENANLVGRIETLVRGK